MSLAALITRAGKFAAAPPQRYKSDAGLPGQPEPSSSKPEWFPEGEHTAWDGRRFPSADLNLAARLVFAEAPASAIGGTDSQRLTIASVLFNRLQRAEFGSPAGLPGVVSHIVKGKPDFPPDTAKKFRGSQPNAKGVTSLTGRACDDLSAALRAVRFVFQNGPTQSDVHYQPSARR